MEVDQFKNYGTSVHETFGEDERAMNEWLLQIEADFGISEFLLHQTPPIRDYKWTLSLSDTEENEKENTDPLQHGGWLTPDFWEFVLLVVNEMQQSAQEDSYKFSKGHFFLSLEQALSPETIKQIFIRIKQKAFTYLVCHRTFEPDLADKLIQNVMYMLDFYISLAYVLSVLLSQLRETYGRLQNSYQAQHNDLTQNKLESQIEMLQNENQNLKLEVEQIENYAFKLKKKNAEAENSKASQEILNFELQNLKKTILTNQVETSKFQDLKARYAALHKEALRKDTIIEKLLRTGAENHELPKLDLKLPLDTWKSDQEELKKSSDATCLISSTANTDETDFLALDHSENFKQSNDLSHDEGYRSDLSVSMLNSETAVEAPFDGTNKEHENVIPERLSYNQFQSISFEAPALITQEEPTPSRALFDSLSQAELCRKLIPASEAAIQVNEVDLLSAIVMNGCQMSPKQYVKRSAFDHVCRKLHESRKLNDLLKTQFELASQKRHFTFRRLIQWVSFILCFLLVKHTFTVKPYQIILQPITDRACFLLVYSFQTVMRVKQFFAPTNALAKPLFIDFESYF